MRGASDISFCDVSSVWSDGTGWYVLRAVRMFG